MKADYHLHTSFSDDSSYPMEEVVKEAIEKGLDEICFTDHVDYGVKVDREGLSPEKIKELERKSLLNVDYPTYFKTIEELKEKYKDQIKIKTGLEFGIQTHTIPDYEKLFNSHDFDFVINSCHQADDLEFWNQDYQKDKTQEEFYKGYYNEILNVAKNYHNYSVLGHLDHHIRYDLEGFYDSEEIDEIIDEILKTVIEDGKGIEVNTSYHRYNIGDLTPSTKILKRYKELGGRIITIGSDSHDKGCVAEYFEETKQALRDLGYTEFCTFDKMIPTFHKL